MRLGDLDVLKEQIKYIQEYVNPKLNIYNVLRIIDNAPTIIWCSETSEGYPLMDLRPREKGEWIKIDHRTYKCSVCNNMIFIHGPEELSDYKFCNGCGADMRGENNGNT